MEYRKMVSKIERKKVINEKRERVEKVMNYIGGKGFVKLL